MTTGCICQSCTFAPVKWLWLILSLYLLGLSVMPCADETQLPVYEPGIGPYLSTVHTASETSHPHEHDACSPFCSCVCCAVTITTVSRFLYSLLPTVEILPTDAVSFHYVSAYLADPLFAIWQPPKVRV